MGCHASTGGDSSGDNGVFGFRDPVAGTEQIGHVIPRSCRIFQRNVPSGQSRYRMAMPPKAWA